MSANQKQPPLVVSQSQPRYTQGPFLQRPTTPQRTDGYPVTTPPTFVQQQSQSNNQVQPLRMPPTGPPTQSSTPPNTDLKVQSMTQQPSMNIAYVSQTQVRGPTQNFFPRPTPPNPQTPRMSNHRQGQPQMYQPPSAQFVPIPAMQTAVYLNGPLFSNTSRPQGYVQGFPMISNPHIYQYQQPQSQPYYYPTPLIQRPPPPVAMAPQNSTQPPPSSMTITQPSVVPTGISKMKRRSNAIPIIDPNTGEDKLKEIYDQESEESLSHPPSGESSARETPQPPISNPSKEVQATFAKQVAQAIGKDETNIEEIEQPPLMEHMGMTIYSTTQNAQQRYDTLAQSSKLQAATKEFIPANATPVVSAITDAEEVTINLSNKQKDRESPAKGRKPREQTSTTRDAGKELSHKDNVIERPITCSKEELKQKDLNVINVAPSSKDTVTAHGQRDEKKIQKKEKIEIKHVPSGTTGCEDSSSESTLVISIPQSISDSSSICAKTKHNASQRVKEVSKQQTVTAQPQQQISAPSLISGMEKSNSAQPQSVVIPTPQQAKTTSKTNKIRDLNMKGASKEGTDMDAFNDNAAFEDANANNSVNNDYISVNNSNNVMLNNNSNNTSVEPKPTENTDIMTIKQATEVKTCVKNKVDVTNVFIKENLKTEKTVMESEDKPDLVVLDNDKLVQVKNEVNNKVSNEVMETNIVEAKLNLPYKEDQWSPFNPEGKKVYDKDFLLSLRTDPKSKLKPDNLPQDIIANDDRGRVGEINRYAVGGRATDFAPNFGNNYSSKSSSQRGGIPPKRKSQQGSIGGNNKGSKQNVIRLSISVKEDVKLHESENAWKPARFVVSANMTEDEKKTEDLYKKVRGVLNKLTPQKFNTLLDQIKNFNIDTTERLQGVIDLVFEKAVDEPNFSVAYATLCSHLALMQVPASSNKKDGQQEYVNFRKLLVTRCQLEFEKNSVDETERNNKVKEIEECVDSEKKKDLLLDLEDYDRRLRMKSVGNIRFIGELFKQQMLTVNIMMRCLTNLLNAKDEESLECLCKLLTTVGKELEWNKKEHLQQLFHTMKEISEKKDGKISSRVRFMIQDVIDLRQSKWVPRRQDLNPKTMDQIQKEAETEQLNIQAMNSVPLSRRDDRGSVGGSTINASSEKKRRNVVAGESEWSVASSRSNRTPQTFSVQCDKLKVAPMGMDEPLGNSQMFGNWVRGSNFKFQTEVVTNSANMYAALATLENDKSNMGLRPREYIIKGGPSLERYTRKSYDDGRGSRSGSQHRSRDSSATSQRNTSTSAPVTPKPQVIQPVPPPTISHELDRKINNIIDESLNDFCTLSESDDDIKSTIQSSLHSLLVSNGYMYVLDRSQRARIKTGNLFAHLIKSGTLSLQDYCIGLETILTEAVELIIDIPKVWVYVAELIVPVLCEKAVTFRDLHKPLAVIIPTNEAPKVLTTIFNLIIEKMGPNFLQSTWNTSALKFSDFMLESEVENFLKHNEFEVFLGNNNDQISPSHGCFTQKKLSDEELHTKLLAFFHSNSDFDDITKWINANVGEGVRENKFFRILTTAIFNFAIVNKKLKDDILRDKCVFFKYYVDHKPNYELQCLYALQSLLHKLEYPQGLLLHIFNKLYEENVFSTESFLSWDASTDQAEQEGRGVAIMQLTSFFTQLKEADDSSSSSAEEEVA